MNTTTFVPKITMVPVGGIKVAPFNPVARTEENQKLRKLMEAIKELGGIVYPLIISSDDRLVDGHRRLEAAKRLGLKEVPCIVIPLELQKGWVLLNDTHWSIRGGSWTEIVYRGVAISNLPEKERRLFTEIHELIGDEGIAEMANKRPPMSPGVLSWAKVIGRYMEDDSDATVGSVLLWLIRCNMQKIARSAMEMGISKAELLKAINRSKPLTWRADE